MDLFPFCIYIIMYTSEFFSNKLFKKEKEKEVKICLDNSKRLDHFTSSIRLPFHIISYVQERCRQLETAIDEAVALLVTKISSHRSSLLPPENWIDFLAMGIVLYHLKPTHPFALPRVSVCCSSWLSSGRSKAICINSNRVPFFLLLRLSLFILARHNRSV